MAHIIPGLDYGGMERLVNELAQALPPRGVEVHVVVIEGFGRFAEGLGGVASLHQVPPMSMLSLAYPGGLITILRAIRPDVVHSHAGVWFKASRAARLARVPVVIHTDHGRPVPDRVSDRLTDNLASRSTDVVIAVSEALAGVLRRRVVHDASRVRVITNGVDVARLQPPGDRIAIRRELGIPEGALVIGSVGRLEPVKNYRLALAAFARMDAPRGERTPTFLVLVGDGRERSDLEHLARKLGIAPRVRFLGWCNDVERLYGAFDLFTLTSRSEGTSVSLLEAMSTGLCPVVTDVGGNRSVLGSDLSALLVPDGDELALALAWERHLFDSGLRRELGERVRERVKTSFSLAQMVQNHVALYHELVDRAGSATAAEP